MKRKEGLWGYLFIAPQLLGLLLFSIGPILFSLGISFTEYSMLKPPKWAGLANYRFMINDHLFWRSLANTTYFAVVCVLLTVISSLIVAVLLNKGIKGVVLFRTIYFLPVVTSVSAVSLVWMWLYQRDFGVINTVLGYFGIDKIAWLQEPSLAMLAVVIMSVWWTMGHYMIILLAGLQGISVSYYEAAKIDGANAWHEFVYITLPMLSPSIFFVVVMSAIAAFKVFGQILMMTEGGPANATYVLILYIYNAAFRDFKMGLATAVSWLFFLLVFVLTLIQFRASNKWVHY